MDAVLNDGLAGLFSCGSFGYWLIKAASFPILGYAALYIARELVRSHTSKNSVGYDYLPGDVQWTRKRAYYYPTICVSAGIAAGLLGIGGGMLKGPIMLEMGLPPKVVAATAAYMLLFTTFSTTIQFSIMGEMMYDYAVLFFFVGLASGTIPNPQSSILNPQSSILSPQSSILNPQSSIFNPQSSILNPQSSILNPQ
jgi:uncharacterized membrane protein YfcA